MASPTRLFLIRHGEVEARFQRVFGGRIDMELSPYGVSQARTLAYHLRTTHFHAVYASPMKRAQQTLAPLAALNGYSPVNLPALREVDFGDWTGLGWEEIKERFGASAVDWLAQLDRNGIPNAESGDEFRERVKPCLRQMLAQHDGQSVAVVCHGGVIRMALAVLLELPLPKMTRFEIDYASLTVVDTQPGKTEIQLLNFTPWRDPP
jgi:broad specificity phosphatase PhoE